MLYVLLSGFLFSGTADCASPQKLSTPTTYEKLNNCIWIPPAGSVFLNSVRNWSSETTTEDKKTAYEKINKAYEEEKDGDERDSYAACLAYALRVPELGERISSYAYFLSPHLLRNMLIKASRVFRDVYNDAKRSVDISPFLRALCAVINMTSDFLKTGQKEYAGTTIEEACEQCDVALAELQNKVGSQNELCGYLGKLEVLLTCNTLNIAKKQTTGELKRTS